MQSKENKDDSAPVSHYAQGGMSYDGKIAGLYDLGETLGSGHFAVVKLARHVFTGAKVAVKVVDKAKLDEVSRSHLFQEVRCMKLVQHPNVVRLYEVIDTQTKLYLILELGDGGDLYDYIMKHEGGLDEELARKYFRQILRAITYCHQLHVVHRDLKPENVVFFEKLGIVKLTDFGFSNKFSPGQKLETFCGSLAYSAPEILLGDSYDAPAVDIWSLGVILYMLVCGQPPFEKANDSETLTMIMDCKYTIPNQVTKACRDLIGTMLVRDPKKRANLNEIAADPWLTSVDDDVSADYLPLISHEGLSEDDHAFIIQKMINGNIASKEDIIRSLEKNKYNHITATYYLLAEIRLRKRREEEIKSETKAAKFKGENCEHNHKDLSSLRTYLHDKKNTSTGNNSSCSPKPHSTEVKMNKRTRKCSIVREEDEEESNQENVCELNELKVSVSHRESISDGRLNKSVQDKVNPTVQGVSLTQISPNLSISMIDQNIYTSKSLLESADNVDQRDDSMGDLASSLGKLKAGALHSKNPVLSQRRTKLNNIRTSSCSSSEASDDDTISRNKKKMNKLVGDTPVRFRLYRRDSYDDSSDSQEQSFSSSGAQSHMVNIISSKTSGNKKTENQSKDRENKSAYNRKSTSSQKCRKQSKNDGRKYSETNKVMSSNLFRQRRVRESQSLDRITEAQEYDLRQKPNATHSQFRQKRSLFSMSYSEVDINEENIDDYEQGLKDENGDKCLNDINIGDKSGENSIFATNSIGKLNFVVEDKSITKAIQVTGSKCIVTIRKIRRLGKYFPVVNLF